MPEKNETEGLITDACKIGPFEITVTERGTLDSMKNAVLSSKVEGATTIISIVPEGTTVKAGDLVCELDSSSLSIIDNASQCGIELRALDLRHDAGWACTLPIGRAPERGITNGLLA